MAESKKNAASSAADHKEAVESMFKAASLGIIISNADGIIEQVNPYANRLFGYESGELVGQKIEVLIPPQLRQRHVEHRSKFNENPRTRSMGTGLDLFALTKSGQLLPVEVSLTHYERNGRKEIVSFVSDITERKKIEDELKSLNSELEKKVEERTQELSQAFVELQQTNQDLEAEMEQRKKAENEVRVALEKEKELNELKSRFVTTASHEFRTPLSAILTSVSLIARYRSAEDEAKRNKHIQTIKVSVQALTNILNDFLSLDKLEKGKVESSPSRFSIREFVGGVVDEMRELAKPNQTIRHLHEGGSGEVFLDPKLLRSVLLNLLSNAIKYSAEGTEIRLSTRWEEGGLELVVEDRGIGIPEVDKSHLFESFFRGRNAASIQGTGLGLNIVKRCVDLMGGTMEFSSQEGRGSRFRVFFPGSEGRS
ncbi:MAG TPA: PAS domain-containing sensor histidine kinase [bacterium]|nr:PAS domain-containing sensor histidine kinase [bacterium]